MADDELDSTAKNLLSQETTTCRPTCKRPINGTNIKFTFFCITFQIILIVLFMALVDYGDHSLPTPTSKGEKAESEESPGNGENKEKTNDISLYYPSKFKLLKYRSFRKLPIAFDKATGKYVVFCVTTQE